MLALEGLSRRFGRSFAVRGVSLDVPAGQMVGVIGAEGAGKSTLLRLINRLIDPTEGAIWHDGIDRAQATGRDLRLWRSECAMICGGPAGLGSLEVNSAVLAGRLCGLPDWRKRAQILTSRERAHVAGVLERLDLAHLSRRRTETLSVAQQHRVAIARALAQTPRIILADDPAKGLDPAQAAPVLSVLRTIAREDGITVICSLPCADLARAWCDRVIALRSGAVVFDGTPDSLSGAQHAEIYGQTAADVPVATAARRVGWVRAAIMRAA